MENQIDSNSKTKEPEAGALQMVQEPKTQCESYDSAYK